MSEFYVILVEPKNPGNVGAVARVMMNFGLRNLILINPCQIDDEAYKRAMHAESILKNARIVDCFEDAAKDMDFLAGTSGISSSSEKHHLRIPVTPRRFSEIVSGIKGRIGILFGREDFGLYNNELARCDVLVNVQTAPEYPIMNISHAVAVVLYELYQTKAVPLEIREASGMEKERFFQQLHEYLKAVEYPDYKKENTEVMVRRILGRSGLSKWEFYSLMGVVGNGIKKIKRLERKIKD